MKRFMSILLVLALLCAGCSSNTPAETTAPPETTAPAETVPPTTIPPETTEETIPVPEVVCQFAKADRTPAVLALLNRGDTVEIVGEYDENHVVIRLEEGYGLLEKALVRLGDAPAFEVKTGYTRYNAPFHSNLRLTGEPAKLLKTNTKVQILEDLGWCYLVELDGETGYISTANVSNTPIKSGGGSGGGADGGDISLKVPGIVPLFTFVPQEGDVTGTGTVLADGTPVILGWFDRGEEIPVVAEEGFVEPLEGYLPIFLQDLYAYVQEGMMRTGDAPAYESWDGFAKYKATLHSDFWLLSEASQGLKTNTKVHVIDELESSYLVEVDGVQGYMAKDMVSKSRIATGGGGGGGAEWSPPAK